MFPLNVNVICREESPVGIRAVNPGSAEKCSPGVVAFRKHHSAEPAQAFMLARVCSGGKGSYSFTVLLTNLAPNEL